MDESKPLNDQTNPQISNQIPIQNIQESSKIIIEQEISEFEKPDNLKPPFQAQLPEEPLIQPEIPLNPTPQPLSSNNQNNTNIITIINNDNLNVNINTNTNNNISNTNLTLVTNTDPGYIASQSNLEISSIPEQ